jgi:hypothetical protein
MIMVYFLYQNKRWGQVFYFTNMDFKMNISVKCHG